MPAENTNNEILQRLMARDVIPSALADLLSRIRPRDGMSDVDLLATRLMTRSLSNSDLITVTRQLESEFAVASPAEHGTEEFVFEGSIRGVKTACGQGKGLFVRVRGTEGPQSRRVRHVRGNDRHRMSTVWAEYRKTQDESVRNALAEHYFYLVRLSASRICRKLPAQVDLEELISAGALGLMSAIEAFDPNRGVEFETYCTPRIRGAILDELRSLNWTFRVVRSGSGSMKSATGEHGAQSAGLSGCDRAPGGPDSESPSAGDPLRESQRWLLTEFITKALSREARLVLILRYYEDLTLKEIGAVLDMPESRVAQVLSNTLGRARRYIAFRSGCSNLPKDSMLGYQGVDHEPDGATCRDNSGSVTIVA